MENKTPMSILYRCMENKTPVSLLHEICAKIRAEMPTYKYSEGHNGGFVCKLTLMEVRAFGNGRTKRYARQMAAHNALRLVEELPETRFVLTQMENGPGLCIPEEMMEQLNNLNLDLPQVLHEFCVRHDKPLPTIDIVEKSSSPKFVARCRVGRIKRFGRSDDEKDARQRAAIEMLAVLGGYAK
ncbi:hypothetical protein KR018_007594 [Drosophila ironensis]|nr:hypothetical protein KR018_007594 [Drosophila ironensis]